MRKSDIVVLTVCALMFCPAASASTPTLQPLPITPTSVPFGATVPGSPAGVSEHEYVLSGHARTFTDGGPTGDAPAYSTRLLVRRPAHFDGAVEVELLNNSAGFEVQPMWNFQRDELARRGVAWVGVTYDPAAVGFLQGWDAQRYSALGSGIADASQVWDIIAQAGALLRGHGSQVLGAPARRLLLTGYSGPAPAVAAWANNFGTAKSPYDAFLIGGSYGSVASLSETNEAIGTIAPPSSVSVIRVDTETELLYTQGASRESDTPSLRSWELAGGSHIDATLAARFSEMWGRDLGIPPADSICANPINPLVVGDAMNAARDDLLRWAGGRTPAPTAPRIRLDAQGNIVRDGDGNAEGGLRLPTVAVPTGTLEPTNVANPNDTTGLGPLCAEVGSFHQFGAARLHALYPTHGEYVSRVAARARHLTRDRFLTEQDAARLVRDAAHSNIGGRARARAAG